MLVHYKLARLVKRWDKPVSRCDASNVVASRSAQRTVQQVVTAGTTATAVAEATAAVVGRQPTAAEAAAASQAQKEAENLKIDFKEFSGEGVADWHYWRKLTLGQERLSAAPRSYRPLRHSA